MPYPFGTPPAVAQWHRNITHEDYNKMLQGFTPQCMEDKCTIRLDKPEDAQGNTVLHIYIGWKPREEISLDIATGDPNKTEAKDWARVTKISWKVEQPGGMKVSQNEAKVRAISICNNLLGCALEEEEEEKEKEEK